VEALLPRTWADVAPMVAVLSVLSVVRPIGWVVSSYQLACDRPRLDAALELGKLAAVVLLLLTLGRVGPLWACTSVGLAFALHALASMVAVRSLDGVGIVALGAQCVRPLVACVPMAAVVLLVRAAVRPAGAAVACEIAAGAGAYVLSALLFAPGPTRELVELVKRSRHAKVYGVEA
jgi:PST family polysaccharide transporter